MDCVFTFDSTGYSCTRENGWLKVVVSAFGIVGIIIIIYISEHPLRIFNSLALGGSSIKDGEERKRIEVTHETRNGKRKGSWTVYVVFHEKLVLVLFMVLN